MMMICPDQAVEPMPSFAVADEDVLPAVSFYDIQTLPIREHGIKCKRHPLPSSTLTSD